jgi:hypothetical protein
MRTRHSSCLGATRDSVSSNRFSGEGNVKPSLPTTRFVGPLPLSLQDPHVCHDIDTDVSLAKNMDEAPISYFGQTRCIVDCLAEAMDCFLLVFIILI